jgi:ribosomal 50S subunit-recycling heat shock protein
MLLFILIPFTSTSALVNTSINPENNIEKKNEGQYKKLEDLKRELKEQRKLIEQQRLEEIKAKELEKQHNIETDINNKKDENNKDQGKCSEYKPKIEKKEDIPSLIVRLRGKHSSKYLCYYNFVKNKDNEEKILAKGIITSYQKLLKKPALKVRPGEIINFEFSEKPKAIKTYIWDEEMNKIKIKKGCIKVPDLDKKIVIAIDGYYKDGYIRYALY